VGQNRVCGLLHRFLKHGPREETAEEIKRVIPVCVVGAEAGAEDACEDEGEDGDHHDGRQHGPGDAQSGAFVTAKQLALREREDQIRSRW